jgi:hypothetical protein
MTSELSEIYERLRKKQQENDDLRAKVSDHFEQLLQAFWQSYKPLKQGDDLNFSQLELKAWIEQRISQRVQK